MTRELAARTALIALLLIVAGFLSTVSDPRQAGAQGSYQMEQLMSEMWDVSAPCFNSGNCNFSCGPTTVGRSCYANICSGMGNGNTAYLTHSEYVCTYTPPASCAAGQIGTPPNCRYPTCADDPTMNGCSCSATNACGQTNYGTYSGGSCSVGAPALPGGYGSSCSVSNSCGSATNYGSIMCNGACSASAPSEASCVPSCVANEGAACNVNSCGEAGGSVQCNGACSGSTPTADKCPAMPGTQCSASECAGGGGGGSISCSPSSQTVSSGASATLTATPSGTTFSAWINGSNAVVSTANPWTKAYSSTESYRARAANNTVSGYCTVTVSAGGGSCSDSGPIDLTATPTRVVAGSGTPVTIEWDVDATAAASCTLTNLNTGASAGSSAVSSCSTSGSANVSGINAQTTFRLACGSLTKDVIVNIVPQFEEF